MKSKIIKICILPILTLLNNKEKIKPQFFAFKNGNGNRTDFLDFCGGISVIKNCSIGVNGTTAAVSYVLNDVRFITYSNHFNIQELTSDRYYTWKEI